jgi:hypothetical protein
VTPDYKYYILMCGIFGPQRSPVKYWNTYEKVFTSLAAADKDLGSKRLFQAIILLFKRHPEMRAQAPTLCKTLYDNNVLSDVFFTQWYEQKLKLDKTSCLYDRKAEKELRAVLGEFVQWLS